MSINNYFVSFEQAKVLKLLGFNHPCVDFYEKHEVTKEWKLYADRYTDEAKDFNKDEFSECISRPLKSQAFEFFREKIGLFGYADYSPNEQFPEKSCYTWEICVMHTYTGEPIKEYLGSNIDYAGYIEAESACIDKLIELAQTYK